MTITVNPNPVISSVTATPNPICVNASSQLNVAATGTQMSVTSIPFSSQSTAGFTSFAGGDDLISGSLPLPFTFTYFGSPKTAFFINTNGQIGFNYTGSTAAQQRTAQTVPSVTLPNENISLCWADLFPTAGQISHGVVGSTPNRIYVINFAAVPFFSGGGTATGQIQLYETSNVIEVHVSSVTVNTSLKTLGIENAAGTVGLAGTGRNNVNWLVAAPEAWRFGPNSVGLTYVWSPGTFLSSTIIANPMANLVTATTAYSVTVTETATTCTATGGVTLTANAALSGGSTITPASPSFCTGGSVLLTANPGGGGGPFTYAWTDPNSNPAGTSQTQSANIGGLWSVAILDACGGSDNASTTVVSNTSPTVAVSPTSAIYCTGAPAIALMASGANTYAWAPPAGLDATTGPTVNASPTVTTIYTVTGTAVNGCTGMATTTITFGGAAPTITSTTATPPTICVGQTSQLQVNATAPSAAYCAVSQTLGTCAADEFISNVTFGSINNTSTCAASLPAGYTNYTGQSTALLAGSVGNAMTITVGQPFAGDQMRVWFDWNQDGDFIDLGEEYSPTGGPGAWSLSVSVPGGAFNGSTRMRVRLTFTGAIVPCGSTAFGESEDYTINVTGGADPLTYSWNNAGTLNNAAIANPVSSATSTTPYTVSVTSGVCTVLGNVTLTVNPLPVVTCGSYSAVCEDAADIALNGSPIGGTWTGTGVTGNNFDPSVGTQTLTYTFTDGNGCTNSCMVTITVNPLPVVTCGGPYGPVCEDAADIALNGSPGGGTWTGTGVTGNNFDPSVGTQTLTYTFTDVNGCTNSCMTTITVNPLPVVTCGSYGPVCVSDPDVVLGGSPVGGTWTGTGVTGNMFDPNAGTQTLTYTYTDGNGCTNSCMTTITVVNTCNDLCGNAIAVGCNSVTNGSTVGTNPDAVPTCGTPLNTAGGVWFTVVGTGGNITASLCGSPYDSKIGVFTTPDCAAFTCVAGDNNFCGDDGQVTFLSTLSQTYHILVTGFGTATGAFTLEVVCAGNNAPPCTDNEVTVDIRTDDFGNETSWEITPVGNTVPVCSGASYANNASIQVDCCLLNGCYTLTFYDSFGDGMSLSTPAGQGGYRLYNAAGKRIIDNWTDGTDFDNPIGGSTSRQANGFCLPIGAIQLTVATCDKEDRTVNDVIVSGIDLAVSADYPDPTSGYQFWVYNPDGGYSRRLYRAHGATSCIATPSGPTLAAHLRLNCLNSSAPFLPCDTLLNVRVRPRLNGTYGEFGPACRLRIPCTPITCPTTQLDNNPLHAATTLSCGVTGKMVNVGGNAGKLFPNIVPGANKYQYEFSLISESYLRTIATPTGSYALTLANWITNPLICGTFTYDVRVRASFDGGANYCPYGPVCTVGITNNPPNYCTAPFQGGGGSLNSIVADDAGMNLWPNPVRSGNVTLELNGLSIDVMTATVDMYDMFGKKVSTNTLATDGAEALTTVLNLKDLATGMYTVNVTSGTQTFTNRLVVE